MRYKDPTLDIVYQEYIKINPNDAKRNNGSWDAAFLDGYEGLPCKFTRTMMAYPAYMAGKELRKRNK